MDMMLCHVFFLFWGIFGKRESQHLQKNEPSSEIKYGNQTKLLIVCVRTCIYIVSVNKESKEIEYP